MNKKKIFNDPVYGFITLPFEIIFDIIEHPYFQRLRRIQQLGLTHYVYPGALHTRFQHALGALHLMTEALEVLRSKGHEITNEEAEAVSIAILLHDIGHGPYSHTLERGLVTGVSHEDLSEIFMNELNKHFNGRLKLAIDIFKNNYSKKFLHQLVSSQLDVDRLDYLNRDSFFTGVYEGVIGYDRIIKMLEVKDDNLVVEAKAIYSIEKFLIARRLMYWQVYLHKTVLSAEQMLIRILQRAKHLTLSGKTLFTTPALSVFLKNNYSTKDFESSADVLNNFAQLDDFDFFTSIKVWQNADDPVLADLCKRIVNRQILKVELSKEPFEQPYIDQLREKVSLKYPFTKGSEEYFVFTDSTYNNAYNTKVNQINILFRNGSLVDISEASDQLNISVLSAPVIKYYLCYPKDIVN